MATIKSTDETYEDLIKKNKIIIFDFFGTWCAPCTQIAPVLEEISEEMKDQIVIAKHDIDSDPNFPTLNGVRGVPSFFLYKDGELKSQQVGAKQKSGFISWIKDNI